MKSENVFKRGIELCVITLRPEHCDLHLFSSEMGTVGKFMQIDFKHFASDMKKVSNKSLKLHNPPEF